MVFDDRTLAVMIMSIVVILALICMVVTTWESGVIVFKGIATEDLSMNVITVSLGTYKTYVKLSNEKIYSILSMYGRVYVKPSTDVKAKMDAIKLPSDKAGEDKYTVNVIPEYRLVDYLEEIRRQTLSPFDAVGYQCKNMIRVRN